MHPAPCRTLPPPANGPAMMAAIRQCSGKAAAAFNGLLPHPLLVLAISRTHSAARCAAHQQALSVFSAAYEAAAQPVAAGTDCYRFAGGRSQDWSPDQRHAQRVTSAAFGQRDDADARSQPVRLSRGRGSGRGRGRSGGMARSDEGSTPREAGSDSASAGPRGASRGRHDRVFGGLRSAGRRQKLDEEVDFGADTGRRGPRGHSSTAASQRNPSGSTTSGSSDRQRGFAARSSISRYSKQPAMPSTAAYAAAAAVNEASAELPDAVPRNAGITGGRWDANDAALVERSLRDAETLRRKFADQGACAFSPRDPDTKCRALSCHSASGLSHTLSLSEHGCGQAVIGRQPRLKFSSAHDVSRQRSNP